MKPFDPQTRRLLDEVTSGDAPPEHLEQQLWQRLAPRLGAPLPETAAAANHALAAKSSSFLAASPLLKLGLGALIAGASVTALVQHRSHSRTHEVQSALTPEAAPLKEVELAAATEAPGGTSDARAVAAQAPSHVALPALAGQATGEQIADGPSAASSLMAETRLIARAQLALRSGQPAVARTLVEQHASVHPNGALAQERDAVRVLVLCALKRVSAARRSQRQFFQTWPGSPLTERVQRACEPPPSSKE